jgi:hypothetical protein
VWSSHEAPDVTCGRGVVSEIRLHILGTARIVKVPARGPVVRKYSVRTASRPGTLPALAAQPAERSRLNRGVHILATRTAVDSLWPGPGGTRDRSGVVRGSQSAIADRLGGRDSLPPEAVGPVRRAAGETVASVGSTPAHPGHPRALFRLAGRVDHRPARHARPMAPERVSPLLVLPITAGPAAASGRTPTVDCRHGEGQCHLG